jgi:hypothetical protein
MLVTFVSGSGSPGCTTTAVGLAAVWPRRVVLVEADPDGGSGILAGYFRGQLDAPGLVDLVIAHRSGLLAEALPKLLLPMEGSDASILLGPRSPDQAMGLQSLWEPLLGVLRSLGSAGVDVLVDAGRLGAQASPAALISESEATVLVCRTDLPALAGARGWAPRLSAQASPAHAVGLLLVGPHRPYTSAEAASALGLPVLAEVEWDPARAKVFSHGELGPRSRWRRRDTGTGFGSPYLRSLLASADTLLAVDPGLSQRPARQHRARAAFVSVLAGRTVER